MRRLGRRLAHSGAGERASTAAVLWQRVPGSTHRWHAAGDGSVTGSGALGAAAGSFGGSGDGKRAMEAMLLPRNFPESVRPEYLTYVQWTALGLVTGRVQSVLATQAALFAVGAGAGAVPMSAAIQWVLKDGLGHAAAVGYATAVNTRFDADARRYRFQSSVANTVADMIAVAMPLAPATFVLLGTNLSSFLVLASLSSATSGIAGVAHAAARARVMASFALRGNLADCTRAGQTQAKLMSLVGTVAGIGAAGAPKGLGLAGGRTGDRGGI